MDTCAAGLAAYWNAGLIYKIVILTVTAYLGWSVGSPIDEWRKRRKNRSKRACYGSYAD